MDSIYDRALLEVGQNGRFQKSFDFIYNCVLALLWNVAYMNMILALSLTPLYTCELPVKPENISEYSWKIKYIPPSNEAKGVEFSKCLLYINPDVNNNTKACNTYSYNKTWYESTISSDNNWVCDKEIYIPNVYAYSRIGEIIGNVFFGWFGDTYGRRLTYIISLALLIVGRFISVLADQYFVLFVIGCVISSFPSYFVTQCTSVISFEISSPERRTTTATLRLVSTSVGLCVMPLLYWLLRDWKIFVIVTTLTIVPFFLLSWKINESPRWLLVQGKCKSCVKELKKIAKTNKKSLQKVTEQELLTTTHLRKAETLGFLALFSNWNLALNTAFQLCIWVAISMDYNVILLSTGENPEGNPFLIFSTQAIVELPGNFLAAWLADHIGRRLTCISTLSVTSLIWALVALCQNSGNSWFCSWWVDTVFVIINRLSLTVTYFTINLLNMELYPTCLRQSGMSLSNIFSNVATIFAPYIIYMGRRYDPRFPGVVLTIVSLLGVISSFLLPETLNASLPETLDDAKLFGKNIEKHQRYLFLPVRNQKSRSAIRE